MNTDISVDFVEVVIKIPRSELEFAQKGYTKAKADVVYRAIENGIVLPKDHGNLKDASVFTGCCREIRGCDGGCCSTCSYYAVTYSDIKNAPVIIPAST